MGFDIGSIGQGIVENTVGAGLGLLLEKHNDARQINQQQKLTNMQLNANKEMAGYNYDRQLQMWKDTSYGAQREQMEKAGINPALMYGMGGGGGITTGSGGGSVGGGTAPTGGGEIMGMMMQKAQLNLMEAQADKTKAEADNIRGPMTELQQAQTGIAEVDAQLKKLDVVYQGQTLEDRIDMLNHQFRLVIATLQGKQNEVYIARETRADQIKIVQQEAIAGVLRNVLTKAQTTNTEQQTAESQAKIKQMAAQIQQGWEQLEQGQSKLAIEQFKAQIDANNPGLWNVIGGELQNVLDEIYKLGQDTRVRRKMPEAKH